MREMIEQRAYELFLNRGGVHGYHMEDWLQAEKEITGGRTENISPQKKEPSGRPAGRPGSLRPAFNTPGKIK
jgi:hypothetical protein